MAALAGGCFADIVRFCWATFVVFVSTQSQFRLVLKTWDSGSHERICLVSACGTSRCAIETLKKAGQLQVASQVLPRQQQQQQQKTIKYKFALVVFERPLAKQREFFFLPLFVYGRRKISLHTGRVPVFILVLVPKRICTMLECRAATQTAVERGTHLPTLISSHEINFYYHTKKKNNEEKDT